MPDPDNHGHTDDDEFVGYWTADQMHAYAAQAVAAERERLRVLVEAVRDANCDAQSYGTFRFMTPGQERAWMALLAGLEGPNVSRIRRD
jgi:hypothetical protein